MLRVRTLSRQAAGWCLPFLGRRGRWEWALGDVFQEAEGTCMVGLTGGILAQPLWGRVQPLDECQQLSLPPSPQASVSV